MAKVEEDGLKRWREGAGEEIDWWNRFRYDCLGLWRDSREEFSDFVTTMNQVDRDIQFTSEIDWTENKVVFLDLTHLHQRGRVLGYRSLYQAQRKEFSSPPLEFSQTLHHHVQCVQPCPDDQQDL